MCRGAPPLDPLRGSRPGAGLTSSGLATLSCIEPIYTHTYLQHPSEVSAIEDALARAQTEAAMWRASFEKAQKVALETNARYSELVREVTRADVANPTSLVTALPEGVSLRQSSVAPKEEGGTLGPWQTIRTEEPWMATSGGQIQDQPQSSTNKQGQSLDTPSEMSWNLSIFDGCEPVPLNDGFATGLSHLVFPATSAVASLGPTGSEVTSPPLMNPAPATDECTGPFASAFEPPKAAPGGLPYALENGSGFRQTGALERMLTSRHAGPTWMGSVQAQPAVYSTEVSDPAEKLKPCLTRPFADVITYRETMPGCQLAGGQEGRASRHPGVATMRRTRQPSARSPRDVSSGYSPVAAAALELAADARCRSKVTPEREAQSPSPSTGDATRRCIAPGCTRRPSYGLAPGAKQGDTGGARWCRAHAAVGAEDLRNLRCCHVSRGGSPCRAQPSYGFAGDKRPTRCRAHAEDGMENVRMPRCRHQGCKRQPLYGEPGRDKKPTRCRNHALPGMKDLRGAMCRGGDGTCSKRPSYGFRGDPRPTRCGSHKETGMEDLISARCDFAGCRTVASYGVQAPGGRVIRRTRCKAHRTPEMTCATKGPACMAQGGCETRPSYGWPDKFDGEHTPRPERCKKHSLPGMEYTGSAARAKKRRQLETVKREPAPVAQRPSRPATACAPAKPISLAPTPRVRPTRKCAAAAAPIIEDDIDEMDADQEQPKDTPRAWSFESRARGSPEAERARLAATNSSRLAEDRAAAARRMRRAELENLGDLRALQELREFEDAANVQMWGGIPPSSPELAGMSELDKDFSSSWGRPESPESGGIVDVNDTLDTACSFSGNSVA